MMNEHREVWERALTTWGRKIDWSDPASLDPLPAPVRHLAAMMTVEGMIGNGGFHALWYNRCHGFIPAAIEGYEALGLPGFAGLLRRAVEMVAADPHSGPRDIWPDPEAKEPVGSGDIGDLEDEWYPLERALNEELNRAKAELVWKRRDVFPGAGSDHSP